MRYAPFVIAGFLLVASGVAQQRSLRRAPGFSLPDQNRRQQDLADYRGKWVLLDFMRTDCPHCVTLTPVLEEAKQRFGQKVVVLSVVMPPDTPQTVGKYILDHKVTGPVLHDCGQVAFSYILPNPANPAIELPHLYVINPEGMIVRDLDHDRVARDAVLGELDTLIGGARKAGAATKK